MQGEKFLPHRELVLQQAGGIFRQHFEARPQAEDGAARGNEKAREGNPFLHAAAKKRYALIDEKGKLKIVGFEYVRRDWAVIAKKTQKEVIEAVLKEGNPQKAIEIVKERIAWLRSGSVPKEELVTFTQIKKPLKSYEAIGPHTAAAQKAINRGKQLDVGSII